MWSVGTPSHTAKVEGVTSFEWMAFTQKGAFRKSEFIYRHFICQNSGACLKVGYLGLYKCVLLHLVFCDYLNANSMGIATPSTDCVVNYV